MANNAPLCVPPPAAAPHSRASTQLRAELTKATALFIAGAGAAVVAAGAAPAPPPPARAPAASARPAPPQPASSPAPRSPPRPRRLELAPPAGAAAPRRQPPVAARCSPGRRRLRLRRAAVSPCARERLASCPPLCTSLSPPLCAAAPPTSSWAAGAEPSEMYPPAAPPGRGRRWAVRRGVGGVLGARAWPLDFDSSESSSWLSIGRKERNTQNESAQRTRL